jgi:ABC-type cobalamin/Fe3+-siderophores transport system ATPase subunit
MLIKDGAILGAGNPGSVLTDAMLKRAFDVAIEIKRSDSGGTYISYNDNF